MSQDLPIYSAVPLRTSLQFAALEQLKGRDDSMVWERADSRIASLESAAGASEVKDARTGLSVISKEGLLAAHATIFSGRAGAGAMRKTEIRPLYRGQDCAPPEFIENSLDNLVVWFNAESFTQIHPIEQCALTITRIADIWPFEFGNLTVGIVFGNLALRRAGLTPFFVLPEHRGEFEKAIAQAMTIDMQPLINAIFQTVRKEMEAVAKR
jgi:Fic family protein